MAEVAIYDTLNDLRNASPKSATGATVVSVRGRTSVDDEGGPVTNLVSASTGC